ncbi:MAG: M14 family zinc carboxypeptidase, partial [Bacteroidota bacterium]
MRYLILLFILCCNLFFSLASIAQMTPKTMKPTVYERDPNTTATYAQTIEYYQYLAKQSDQFQLLSYGMTDSGRPLHLAVLSKEQDFDPQSIRKKGKNILMINNAIHPGEPCGVDATMLLLKDLLTKKELQAFLEHTTVIVIPIYNIGGTLNRNSTTRANQNGPKAYGFRGNAKNLDLNRDFIKCDSRNAQTFNQIFNEWKPDVLVDNHTSNGADYQYTMTLIATQHNKLNPHLSTYLDGQLVPHLYQEMEKRNWEMTPYVYAREKPDDGIAAFLDLPRYSSGYAALHHCLSFMPETHMLKPFADRVESTRVFMEVMLERMHADHQLLAEARKKAYESSRAQKVFPINWAMDAEQKEMLLFKGYEASHKPSAVSGLDRLYYDRDQPFEKEIPYFKHYTASASIEKPEAYIIPQAYWKVLDRLRWNGVEVHQLKGDQEITAEFYRILDFKTVDAPYEGHYLHR